MNRIKSELSYPAILELCNVTNLYKQKGDKSSFNSYRGIFRAPVLSNILDKLIHNDEYETIDENLTDGNVGSRKRRNVRDNLFVMNAIMSQAKNNKSEPTDISVYDVHKCFDSMWLLECINDLYEAGLRNDKLCLLYMANKHAQIVIKTATGSTNQLSITKKVMQGRVWGGLMCTTTMDKLCQLVYDDKNLLYKYKGTVDVPPLEMVDDIITASKCGSTSIAMNETVNTFIELKKLKLSESKCSKIHVGKKENPCPDLRVHDDIMKTSDKEKYLGDQITSKANSKDTIEARISRGNAVLAQMTALLSDLPLGKRRTETGMILRSAWFLNGCLFNSEVWTGYLPKDLHALEVIDHQIMRLILGAQAKAPTEMLYLETAQLPIPDVISVRRLSYLHTILNRHTSELIRKVYQAMKEDPSKDDWVNLVKTDLEDIGMNPDSDVEISVMSKDEFKKLVKKKVREKTFKYLEGIKQSHKKVKDVVHDNLNKPQEYLTSNLFDNKEKTLLYNLRSQSENEYRANFSHKYSNLRCPMCDFEEDSQLHALSCETVKQHLDRTDKETIKSVLYSDIFSCLDKQLVVTRLFQKLISIRQNILKNQLQSNPAHHGLIVDLVDDP